MTLGKSDRPIFRDRFFQGCAHTEIGAGHRAFELARREDEGRLLGVEADGNPEETAIGSGVVRRPPGQEHFVRQSPAEFPHHVEADCGRAIAQMIGALGSRLVDRIADPGQAVADVEINRRAPDVATLVVDQVLQCAAKGRGVAHQTPDEPEASRVATLADQKPKVRASRSCRRLLKKPTRRGEGYRILRIVEHANVDADDCRNLGGIGAKLSQELGASSRTPTRCCPSGMLGHPRPFQSVRELRKPRAVKVKSNSNSGLGAAKWQARRYASRAYLLVSIFCACREIASRNPCVTPSLTASVEKP